MKNYIIGSLTAALLFFSACSDKLDVIPQWQIQDQQIKDLLASGDSANVRLIIGSMANNMPLLFNLSGIHDAGTADYSYYTKASLGVIRCLEGNDMVLGDRAGLGILAGEPEYNLNNFQSANNSRDNGSYWNYGWQVITQANQLLDYLTDDFVGNNAYLEECKARGLVVRAFAYNFLMENYQDAYMQGGNSKLGMPLYTTFDPYQDYKARSSAEETYAFIKDDINTAITLLKDAGVGYTTATDDIDLAVANFILARISLVTGDWATALSACDDILSHYTTLMDQSQYGSKNTGTASNPVFDPEDNGFLNNAVDPEVILGFPLGVATTYFNSLMNPFGGGYGGLNDAYKRIDERLYNKIAGSDYRKDCFQGSTPFGDYSYPPNETVNTLPSYINFKFASTQGFDGQGNHANQTTIQYMRSSEVLLMKAEAQAQNNQPADAKATLNILLKARTRNGATPLTCANYPSMAGMTALEMVQLQTRIEMWGEGGLEFYNNKRWNIPVDRAGSTNHLNKGSMAVSEMTMEIPIDEMNNNPKMKQNQ